MTTSTVIHPLDWPQGWPRAAWGSRVDGRGRFQRQTTRERAWSFPAALDALIDELRRLGADQIVITTNVPVNRNGTRIEGRRPPDDPGVAVYFMLGGERRVMARDPFDRTEENLRTLTLAVAAMRALETHGGDYMSRQAFAGFTALPPPKTWRDVLGVPAGATEDEINYAFRYLSKSAHPDVDGGSHARMAELSAARDAALKELKANA